MGRLGPSNFTSRPFSVPSPFPLRQTSYARHNQIEASRIAVSASGLSIITSWPESTSWMFHPGSFAYRSATALKNGCSPLVTVMNALRGTVRNAPETRSFSVAVPGGCGVNLLATHEWLRKSRPSRHLTDKFSDLSLESLRLETRTAFGSRGRLRQVRQFGCQSATSAVKRENGLVIQIQPRCDGLTTRPLAHEHDHPNTAWIRTAFQSRGQGVIFRSEPSRDYFKAPLHKVVARLA